MSTVIFSSAATVFLFSNLVKQFLRETFLQCQFDLFLFILGYLGYFQSTFFDVPKVLKKKFIKEKIPHYNGKVELKRLSNLFIEKKIFTRQKLTVKDVATHLELPERYVSWIINFYHNMSFRQYVNSFRVKESILRIEDLKEANKTLVGIAMESGFSS